MDLEPRSRILLAKGYKVVAAPNLLRGVSSDAAYVSSILKTIDGPIILVGHSYGGAVFTNAANGNNSVKALVYVAAFAPDRGESMAELQRRFPGSTIEASMARPIRLADGSRDLYFRRQRTQQHWQLMETVDDCCLRYRVDKLLIEAKASGISAAQELRNRCGRQPYAVHLCKVSGDKVARALAVQPILSQALVYAANRDSHRPRPRKSLYPC
jgi:pimeloyl-ACP methyl ester carboxylesterase